MKGPILIVEDDVEIRQSLIDILEDEGFSVMAAENGEKGLEKLKTSEKLPALVLLDLTMPVMDGLTFRREQLKDPKWAEIPIALLSADGQLAEKALQTGANAYIKKPVDLLQLYSLAQKYCKE